ncbi:MAG: flagellar hook assembly protein FlgD [Betaproteobacteria bacterium]|nr:flagellar hook assembly protein FlgD [Betaproteobacteria bacterium]
MTTIAELQSTLGASTAKASTSSAADAQDRFLKLLVTQMQNQDPLNPMDNAQVTTQLAQLNTVTGIEQLNKTLGQMAASSAAQQSLQAAMLVGREVLVAGNQISFSGQPVRFGVDLPQAVDGMTIDIADSKGNVVESFQTGAQPQGATTLEWDGLDASGTALPAGKYVVSAKASSGSAAVTATTLISGKVQSVGSAADGSIQLQLSGAGNVGIADIKRFL